MALLSILTITYNAEEFIGRTLRSVKEQTSQDFEYVVIDGASKDRTLELLNECADRIDVLVSEPDKGLYDAMNKALQSASGKYIWYMNAGDEIAEKDTVEKVLNYLSEDPDVLYSDTFMVDNSGSILGLRSELLPHQVPEKLAWEKYNLGMLVCHQSFIAKTELAPVYIDDNLSADIDWEIKCLKRSSRVVRYPGILSKYLIGGISNQKKWKSLKDRYKVLRAHFGFFPNLISHIRIVFRSVF